MSISPPPAPSAVHIRAIDRIDHSGNTPLLGAIRTYNLPLVRSLLSRRVDYRIRDRRGWSALHHAVHTHASRDLAIDAERDTSDEDGEEPSSAPLEDHARGAVRRGIIHALVSAGAAVEARTPDGDTPLLVAARSGRAFGVMAYLIVHGARIDDAVARMHPWRRDVRVLRRLERLALTSAHVAALDAQFVRVRREVFDRYVKDLVGSFVSWTA